MNRNIRAHLGAVGVIAILAGLVALTFIFGEVVPFAFLGVITVVVIYAMIHELIFVVWQ